MRKAMVVLLLAVTVTPLFAGNNSEYISIPFNVSLWRNLSIGDALARSGQKKVSVNGLALGLVAGRSAKLRGIDLSIISSEYTEDVWGAQASGLCNVVSGDASALQISGLCNVVEGSLKGVQLTGLVNVVDGDVNVAQISGLANVVDGDVNAAQISGLANVVDGGMGGFQASGLTNVVDGDVNAAQISGLANVVDGRMNGFQASGLANVVDREVRGAQVSGLVNVTDGSLTGIQASGLVNINDGNVFGTQVSALMNITHGELHGAQFAGFLNLTDSDIRGAQLGGIFNVNIGDLQGVQICGLLNAAIGSVRGMQISGFYNRTVGDFSGLQSSGFLNKVDTLKAGIQLGVINISRKNHGLALGLVSYVEEVGLEGEISSDETRFFRAGLRSGTKKFYNLFSLGFRPGDPFRWSFDWGFGSHLELTDISALEIGLLASHINESKFWTDKTNLLARFQLSGVFKLSNGLTLFAGPSFNFWLSGKSDGSDIAPWSVYDRKSGGKWIRLWPGLTAGIRF